MQALILAAGCGKRLRPLTDYVPKSLVEVNGIPLLVNALECLSGRGIGEVLLVVGDKKEMIVDRLGFRYKEMRIVYIDNPLYLETNNIYSFWLARPYVHDDVVMLECDLFYQRSLVDRVFDGDGECRILVSPFNREVMDGTVVTVDGGNQVKSLTIKREQGAGFDYSDKFKTVNIYWFNKDFILNKLFPFVETYVKQQSVNSYYELVLGGLIYWGNSDIRAVCVDEVEWCEIDDMEDLKKAEKKLWIHEKS
mgnify:CR=1 FL=1|jgi:aminotransferase class I and II